MTRWTTRAPRGRNRRSARSAPLSLCVSFVAGLGAASCGGGGSDRAEGGLDGEVGEAHAVAEPEAPSAERADGPAVGEGSGAQAVVEAVVAAADAPPAEAEPTPPVEPPPPSITEIALGDGPLTGEAHAIFWGTAEDPPTEHLDAARPELEGRHFLRSDEKNHHAFRPHISGLGGAYAGVGAEQAYTFASWSGARLVWLTDYDPWIKQVHLIYRAFLLESPDIETFLARFEDDAEDDSLELLRTYYEDSERWDLVEVVWDALQERARRRFRWMVRTYERRDIPSWVTDPDLYDYVRTLVEQERVRPMIANLLDDEAFRAMGEASHALGVPLRVLYISNAESYWDYTDDYRQNISSQFIDERSVLLRTNGAQGTNGDYRYVIQPLANYIDWLGHPEVEKLRHIWRKPRMRGEDDIPLELLFGVPGDEPVRGERLPFDDPVTPGVD